MATKADVFAQIILKEGGEERPQSFSLSDQDLVEYSWDQLSLATNSTVDAYQVIGGDTATKPAILIKSDKIVRVQAITRNGASSNLTTIAGYGFDIYAGGAFMVWADTSLTHLWLTNNSATDTAIVNVAILEI